MQPQAVGMTHHWIVYLSWLYLATSKHRAHVRLAAAHAKKEEISVPWQQLPLSSCRQTPAGSRRVLEYQQHPPSHPQPFICILRPCDPKQVLTASQNFMSQ